MSKAEYSKSKITGMVDSLLIMPFLTERFSSLKIMLFYDE